MSSLGLETPVKKLGVATHHTLLSPAVELGRQSGHAHRLCRPPPRCYVLLFSPPLALTAVTREGYSLRASLNDLRSPPPQHLRTSTNRQGRENKLTMSLRRHLNFMVRACQKTAPFLPERIEMQYSDTTSVLVVITFFPP